MQKRLKRPRTLTCPCCGASTVVYHFAWSALTCEGCGADVQKGRWIVEKE
jgi:ribosomal protein S27E